MFNKLVTFGKIYENYMTRRGKQEAHRILLQMGNRTLEDIGISRQELLGGVENWPWDGSATKAAQQHSKSEQKKAISQLHACTDRELHDLGISRGMITDAVKNGRPEFDKVEKQLATAQTADAAAADDRKVA